MTHSPWGLLLDPPSFPAERYAALADRIAKLLATTSDVVLVRAESRVALEAVATSVAGRGIVAVNVVTSPYGEQFGSWLRRGGASVVDVVATKARSVTIDAVAATLRSLPHVDVLAIAHGEAASGLVNPLEEIARLAHDRGAVVVVDAVASVGAEPLRVDQSSLDVVVVGTRKALGGPAGISAVAVSQRGWAACAESPFASVLSLLELKQTWLDTGRLAIPGTPGTLELWALDAALDRVEAEGIDALVARHRRAALATRSGLRALGAEPWIADEESASGLVTTVPVASRLDPIAVVAAARDVFGVALTRGVGEVADRLVRLNHAGPNATFAAVSATVMGYGGTLRSLGAPANLEAAAAAVVAAYAQ